MNDKDGLIWYDGTLVPWREATTHVLTHSLHYGVSVFEGMRAYATSNGAALFRASEHAERLIGSAHIYRMPLEHDIETIVGAQREVVARNQLPAAYVRTIAFYGPEKFGVSPRGARVHVAIAAFPWGAYLGANAQERGIRVKTSSYVRSPPHAVLPRAKLSASYATSILAHQEVTDDGYDEALLLDVDGFVAEGAGENLFIVKHGVLYEPEPASALAGITRDSIRTIARDLGYSVVTGRLTRDSIYLADEAFFCGTAAEITPIVELDRRVIGSGTPGPITRHLSDAFQRATDGSDARYAHWLTHVSAA